MSVSDSRVRIPFPAPPHIRLSFTILMTLNRDVRSVFSGARDHLAAPWIFLHIPSHHLLHDAHASDLFNFIVKESQLDHDIDQGSRVGVLWVEP